MREKSSNSAEIKLFKIDREKVLNFLRSYAKKLVDEGGLNWLSSSVL